MLIWILVFGSPVWALLIILLVRLGWLNLILPIASSRPEDGAQHPYVLATRTGVAKFVEQVKRWPSSERRTFGRNGSVHVATSLRMSLALATGSLILSMLLYAFSMQQIQSSLQKGIEGTPVIRDILETSLGQPLRPMPGFTVSKKWDKDSEVLVKDFDDQYPVAPKHWLEVLKRLGLAEADASITDYVGSAVSDDNKPTQTLLAKLQAASKGKPLYKIVPLSLLANLAAELGNATSGELKGDAALCWAPALSQAMTGFPDRWQALAGAVREGHKAGKGCPWTDGELKARPSLLRYLVFFSNDTPSEAVLARTLLEGTGRLKAQHPDAEPPKTDVGSGPAGIVNTAAVEAPAALSPASSLDTRTTILAEQLARQLFAATMTTADVRVPKLWLDALVGFPQALLNWFFIMLLAFVFARMLLLRKMRSEISIVTAWLDQPTNKSDLMELESKKRAVSAERMAEKLEGLQVRPYLSPSGKQLEKEDRQLRATRRHSLILLMAEKAMRRLVVGEAQPELFREFCAARRAMVDESAWFLRYMSRALPALGFVGTILGILFALNGADGIVRASSQAERVSAMSAVTGPLAFAFSHTFIALAAGLITGFLIDRETAQERLALLSYEESLIEKIDLAERDAQPSSGVGV